MTRLIVLAVFSLSLAACGVDGAPTKPKDPKPEPLTTSGSITLSGKAKVGIAGGNG
jgi:hypothetical protein